MTTPFLGRSELFANAFTALQQRRVVGLYGSEGVGKTRLALELAQALIPTTSKRGVVRGSHEMQRFPFAAILHLVRSDLELSNPMLALRQATEDVIAQPIVVLTVDDVQLLDPSTEAVVHSLATRSGPRIILTARTDVAPNSFRRLARDHDAFVAEVPPLDNVATRALCAAVAGMGLSGPAETRLLQLAGGNPLLAVELTLAGVSSGALVENDSVLELVQPLPASKLRDLVASQLGALSSKERRAMELLALGEQLGSSTLTHLVEPEVVAGLQERRLITERSESRNHVDSTFFMVSHPLFVESIIANLPAFRRSMLLVDLADAISTREPKQSDDAARQALWLFGAGHDISSADLAGAASGLNEMTLKSFVKLVSSDHSTKDATHERSDSSRLLASTIRDRYGETARLAELAYQQDPNVANAILLLRSLVASDHALDRAAAVIEEWCDRPLPAEDDFSIRRLARLIYGYHLQNPERAREIVKRTPLPSGMETAISVELASIDLNAGLIAEASEALQAALADTEVAPFTRVITALELSIGRMCQGRVIDTMSIIDDHFPLAVAHVGEPSIVASFWWMRCVAASWDGRFAEAESMLLSTFNACVAGDSVEGAGFFADGLAQVARTQGRFRTAVRRARQSVDLLGVRDVGQRAHALGELALALCALGETTTAREALDQLAMHHNLRPSARPMLPLAQCYVETLEGKPLTVDALDRVLDEVAPIGGQATNMLLWIAASLGQVSWAARHVDQVRCEVQGRINLLQLDVIEALEARKPERLAELLLEAQDLRAYGISYVLADEGRRLANSTSAGSTLCDWNEAAMKAQRLSEGVRPWQASRQSTVTGLSRREAHIARLAQSGLTDATIAERLGLSVRTVESHLTRAYAKLGIRSRKELAHLVLAE